MKTRVALITEIIAPYRIPVFNALARDPGIDLQVIFLSETDPSLREWPIYKDEIDFSYQVLPHWRAGVGARRLLINWGMKHALDRFSPEAIVCGGYNYIASWQAKRWSSLNKVPLLAWIESTSQDKRSGLGAVEAMKANFLSECAGVIVAGRSSMEYAKSFNVASDRIVVAPDAVDNDFFMRAAEAARSSAESVRERLNLPKRYFLYCGRLVREKGVFDLLEAYAALPPSIRCEVGLVFAGDGQARAKLESIARQQTLGEIRFTGFQRREQLAELYALADALMFPTHSDPWGLVVNEAMACGLPVIATNVAGCVADLVEDGWNGRVVDKRNPRQLASAMAEIASHPDITLLGGRSAERIGRNSPERCAAGFVEAIQACSPKREEMSAGATA